MIVHEMQTSESEIVFSVGVRRKMLVRFYMCFKNIFKILLVVYLFSQMMLGIWKRLKFPRCFVHIVETFRYSIL